VGTNRYAYAGNDPVNKSDPNGHDYQDEHNGGDSHLDTIRDYNDRHAGDGDSVGKDDDGSSDYDNDPNTYGGSAPPGEKPLDLLLEQAEKAEIAAAIQAALKAAQDKAASVGANPANQAVKEKEPPPVYFVLTGGRLRNLRNLLDYVLGKKGVDGTGKFHGDLPKQSELRNLSKDELKELADDLRNSITQRKSLNNDLGWNRAHADRLRKEENLLKSIEKLTQDWSTDGGF
jgi:hypothetical protein